MRERVIEGFLKREVEKQGGLCLKSERNAKGFPDRMILAPERAGKGPAFMTAFVELKRPGQKPTQLQQHWLDLLNRMGHLAVCLDSKEAVREFVRDFFS